MARRVDEVARRVNAAMREGIPARVRFAREGKAGSPTAYYQGRTLTILAPMVPPGGNGLLRMHWAKRKRMARDWWHLLNPGVGHPGLPMQECKVTIKCHVRRPMDQDNRVFRAKVLLDVLQPASPRHPHGLGIIASDAPTCLRDLEVIDVTRDDETWNEGTTEIIIEDLTWSRSQ